MVLRSRVMPDMVAMGRGEGEKPLAERRRPRLQPRQAITARSEAQHSGARALFAIALAGI